MNIIETINEYKSKIEALAGKAAQAETALASLDSITSEKEALTVALVAKETALQEANEKTVTLENEVNALKADIEKRENDKKASDEKALEIVASLGLQNIPVITITESSKPTAESIQAKYLAISDSIEKGKFFAENKNAILNGIIE